MNQCPKTTATIDAARRKSTYRSRVAGVARASSSSRSSRARGTPGRSSGQVAPTASAACPGPTVPPRPRRERRTGHPRHGWRDRAGTCGRTRVRAHRSTRRDRRTPSGAARGGFGGARGRGHRGPGRPRNRRARARPRHGARRSCARAVRRIDVLVNNAGGQFVATPETISAKGWRAVHRLNVDAVWDSRGRSPSAR